MQFFTVTYYRTYVSILNYITVCIIKYSVVLNKGGEGRGGGREGGTQNMGRFKIFYSIPFIASDGAHVSPLRFIVRLVSRCKKLDTIVSGSISILNAMAINDKKLSNDKYFWDKL